MKIKIALVMSCLALIVINIVTLSGIAKFRAHTAALISVSEELREQNQSLKETNAALEQANQKLRQELREMQEADGALVKADSGLKVQSLRLLRVAQQCDAQVREWDHIVGVWRER